MHLRTGTPHRLALAILAVAAASCGSEPEMTGRGRGGRAAGSGSSSLGSPSVRGPTSTVPTSSVPLPAAGSFAPAAPTPGSQPIDGLCEVVQLVADPVVPDMMIVLDRSGSMTEGGRWQPSVSAVRKVTAELQDRIRFGLAMFPDPAASNPTAAVGGIAGCFSAPDPQTCLDMMTNGANNAVCAPGKIVVPVADGNADEIAQMLDGSEPNGGTPTAETLQGLVDTYAGAPAGPDQKPQLKYVLLVTDGQPTCPAGMGADTTPADIDASNAAIDALTAKDVKTYVIGYDTTSPGNEALATVLDGFAQRGGTGDQMHRPVEDETSLLTELQRITGEIAGCAFSLSMAPQRADFVLVRLDGQQINLNDPNGWRLNGDREVELVGSACESFKTGAHTLKAEVQCDVVGPG
jgi:hypothetical protein